jgi:hypothetical protein
VASDEHARKVYNEIPERYVSLFLSPVRPVTKTPPIPKQRPKKPATKPPVVKKALAKKLSLAVINAAAAAASVAGDEHAREVFDKMPERYVSLFLSYKLCSFAVSLSVCVVRCSQGTDSFVGMLNEASIDIYKEPLGDYENTTLGSMMPRMWRWWREMMMSWKRWTPVHMKMPQAKKITLQEGRQITPRWNMKL